MTESEFAIIEPKPSLFKRVMVSATYTAFIAYALYLYKEKILVQDIDIVVVVIYLAWILGVIILFTAGSISRHSIQFNFEEKKIRHVYDISIYRYKEVWQDLNDLNYFSIYKQDDNYNVIMWYEEHSFLNLFSMKSYDEIIEQGHLLADGFNVDLLDATINNDLNNWIDKGVYKSTGEIIHYFD